jgi:hypothetical protein
LALALRLITMLNVRFWPIAAVQITPVEHF